MLLFVRWPPPQSRSSSLPVMLAGWQTHKTFVLNEVWITTQCLRCVWFRSAQPSSPDAELHATLLGEKSMNICTERDGWSAASLSVQVKTFSSFYISFRLFHLLSPLIVCLPMQLSVFYLFLFHSLCVKSWFGTELEDYNLEETWDPITETNTVPALHPTTASQPHAGQCGWILSARHTTPCLLISLRLRPAVRLRCWKNM